MTLDFSGVCALYVEYKVAVHTKRAEILSHCCFRRSFSFSVRTPD